jgi:phage major head subunit gpT-like protein
MPAPSQISASEVLARGLRTEFAETYKRAITRADALLSAVMELNVPSNKLSEIYGYFESAPHLRRWERGQDIPRASMRARNYQVPNVDWAIAIDWHENDEQDDQSRSLMRRAREAGASAGILQERVFFQLLLAAVDNDLLKGIPNAPDGVSLFSATDATGANRFGVSGGNMITTSGISSTAAIQNDFFTAVTRFGRYLDTEGQPLWPREQVEKGVVIIYNVANEFYFRQAFQQAFNAWANVGGTSGTAASPTNVILDSGLKYRLWASPRITTNAWYTFLEGSELKAIFEQVRQPLRDNLEDMLNSDNSRRTKNRSLQWDMRSGFGINLPYQVIQIA